MGTLTKNLVWIFVILTYLPLLFAAPVGGNITKRTWSPSSGGLQGTKDDYLLYKYLSLSMNELLTASNGNRKSNTIHPNYPVILPTLDENHDSINSGYIKSSDILNPAIFGSWGSVLPKTFDKTNPPTWKSSGKKDIQGNDIGTLTVNFQFEYVTNGGVAKNPAYSADFKGVSGLYNGVPVSAVTRFDKTARKIVFKGYQASGDMYLAYDAKYNKIVGSGYRDANTKLHTWLSTAKNTKSTAAVLLKSNNFQLATNEIEITSDGRRKELSSILSSAGTLIYDDVAKTFNFKSPTGGLQPKKLNIGYANAYNLMANTGKLMFEIAKPGVTPTPYDPGQTCDAGTITKRADGTCLAPVVISNADTLDAKPSSSQLILQNEAEGFFGIAANLGIPNVGQGYDWTSDIPRDADDYTELDHTFIWDDSENLDDALDEFEDAVSEKLEELDEDNLEARQNIATALNKLKYINRARTLDLIASPNDGKETTAEARDGMYRKLSGIYADKFKKSTEQEENEADPEITSSPEEDSMVYDADYQQGNFGNYKSKGMIASIEEQKYINAAQGVLPGVGSTEDSEVVGEGDNASLDTFNVVGSTSYIATLKTIGKLIVDVVKDEWDQELEIKEEELDRLISNFKKIKVALSSLNKSVKAREEAIEENLVNKVEVTDKQATEYGTIHDIASEVSDAMASVHEDISLGSLSSTESTGLSYDPRPGAVEKLNTKKPFKATPGTNKNFFSGMRAKLDSNRRSRQRELKSTRNTVRLPTSKS